MVAERLVSDSKHYQWKYWQQTLNAFDEGGGRGGSSRTNQNSAWSTESKRNWQNRKTQKGRKAPLSPLCLKGWQRQSRQHWQQALRLLPQSRSLAVWIELKRAGPKRVKKVQPTTSLTGCLAVTFQLWLEAACCRHLMRVHVRVHKRGCLCAMFSGTSAIISLTVFFFFFFSPFFILLSGQSFLDRGRSMFGRNQIFGIRWNWRSINQERFRLCGKCCGPSDKRLDVSAGMSAPPSYLESSKSKWAARLPASRWYAND